MRVFHSLLFFVFCLTVSFTQAQSVSISYSSSDEVISNPERGFYHHTEVHSESYGNLNEETLRNWRITESITQIIRVFYLEDFRDRPIAKDYLNNMRQDFSAARNSGVKVIIRFAYSQGTAQPYNDAQPAIVFMHIQQLKDVLRENADVIAVMQAGFVGTWGEWYYTEGFAGNGPSDISAQNYADRAKVVSEILKALPKDRMVQIRTPGYKMRMYDTEEPITIAEAHSGIDKARVGHHNDCFVASSSDFGTYRNPDLEKPYLEKETAYMPMGGETCAVAPPYSDCENGITELERFHWSYLNIDYNRDVLNEWEDQGCFDEVELRLGYRYVMNSATITNESRPSGVFNLSMEMHNIGYSSPYNPKEVELILRDNTTEIEYLLVLDGEDPRFWPLGETFNIDITAGLPIDIQEGDYQVYLKIGDNYPALQDNPSYSIQMANSETWEPSLGYNDLGVTLNVSDQNVSNTYVGDDVFSLAGDRDVIDLPTQMYGGAAVEERIIFWGVQSDMTRVIERSIDEAPFVSIAVLNGNVPYFRDFEELGGSPVAYRFKLQDQFTESEYSNTVLLTKSESDTVKIAIDGDDSDWKNVSTIASVVDDNTSVYASRFHFDATKVNFILYGEVNSYEVFLEVDNTPETGNPEEGALLGMDYVIRDQELFKLEVQSETGIASISDYLQVDGVTEFSFDISLLEELGSNPIIGFYALVNGAEELGWTDDQEPSKFYMSPQPDLTDTFYFENPRNDNTSTQLFWDACTFCNGYELERSDDGVAFETVANVIYNVSEHVDRGLIPGNRYFYRLRAHNALGYTSYSDVIDLIAGSLVLQADTPRSLLIYPNPVEDQVMLFDDFNAIEIYNLAGSRYMNIQEVQDRTLDLTFLEKGIYVVHAQKGDEIWVGKIIKK